MENVSVIIWFIHKSAPPLPPPIGSPVNEFLNICSNPKNFINPYNAEKIALANELYSIVIKENLTYNELVEVDKKSKLL